MSCKCPRPWRRRLGRLGFERAKRGDLVDAMRLDANYVRRSDAEVGLEGWLMRAPGEKIVDLLSHKSCAG